MHKIYIAGPEVFYPNGQELLGWMRLKSEACGFGVTLPNDTPLEFTDDLQGNARAIYVNCQEAMNESDSIICDLAPYRGSEPDGGSVFELGMAFARGIRLYGYAKDRRPLRMRDPNAQLVDGRALDAAGWDYPYVNLPFAPSIMGSTTVVEGDFSTALGHLVADLERAERAAGWSTPEVATPLKWAPRGGVKPRVYFSSVSRYAPDADERTAALVKQADTLGIELIVPRAPELESGPLVERSAKALREWVSALVECDFFVADLADFHGWEPSSDVSFESGVAAQLGIPSLGFMPDARRTIDRVPHLGEAQEFRDLAGANVENFDFPMNLMFSGYMPVIEADPHEALQAAAGPVKGI